MITFSFVIPMSLFLPHCCPLSTKGEYEARPSTLLTVQDLPGWIGDFCRERGGGGGVAEAEREGGGVDELAWLSWKWLLASSGPVLNWIPMNHHY